MALPYMYGYSWTSSTDLAAGAEQGWMFGPRYWPGRSIDSRTASRRPGRSREDT